MIPLDKSPDTSSNTENDKCNNKFDCFLDNHLEPLLWMSRYFILVCVLCSIGAAVLVIIFVGLSDSIHFIFSLGDYLQLTFNDDQTTTNSSSITDARNNLTFTLVEMIDAFLMSGVLFIFGFGLYELFISRITPAKTSTAKGKILNIRNIDELKSKLAKVILMMLIVKCFYYIVRLPEESFNSVIDIALLAGSIALIALALYLSHSSSNHQSDNHTDAS